MQGKITTTSDLSGRTTVVAGASRGLGREIASAFAREAARVFLTGRNLVAIETVAKEISAAGGTAETAEVDALDETAVEGHLDTVVKKAGTVDISFNAIGIPQQGMQGIASPNSWSRAGRRVRLAPQLASASVLDGPTAWLHPSFHLHHKTTCIIKAVGASITPEEADGRHREPRRLARRGEHGEGRPRPRSSAITPTKDSDPA
jgi:hypothetical protein